MTAPVEKPAPVATDASPSAVNSNLKKPVGISLSPATDRVIMLWVDHLGQLHQFAGDGRKPTRGTVITEIVDKLLAAGWKPGDEITVRKAKKK